MQLQWKLPYRRHPTYHSMDDFLVVRKLGEGGSSVVSECQCKSTGSVFAVKHTDLSKTAENPDETWEREVEIHSRLTHPHIVRLVDYFLVKDQLFMVLENCSRGTLLRYMSRRTLDDYQVMKLFRQACLAVAYLHSRRVLMRDIKPENILLDAQGNVKLCDFGWSAFEHDASECSLKAGTFEYMSPETLKRQPQSFPADIWGLGVLLYEMATGNEPFVAMTPVGMLNLMARNAVDFQAVKSLPARDLIKRMLNYDPERRPSIQEVLADAYFSPLFVAGYSDEGPRFVPPAEGQPASTTPSVTASPSPPTDLSVRDHRFRSMVVPSTPSTSVPTPNPVLAPPAPPAKPPTSSATPTKPSSFTGEPTLPRHLQPLLPPSLEEVGVRGPRIVENRVGRSVTQATNTYTARTGFSEYGLEKDPRPVPPPPSAPQPRHPVQALDLKPLPNRLHASSSKTSLTERGGPVGPSKLPSVSQGSSTALEPRDAPLSLVNLYSKRAVAEPPKASAPETINIYRDIPRTAQAPPRPPAPVSVQPSSLPSSVGKRSAPKDEGVESMRTASASPNPTRKLFKLDANTNRYVEALFSE